MTPDDLPNPARRAMVFRDALMSLGVAEEKIFIALGVQVLPMPTDDGQVSLNIVVSRTGNASESVDWVLVCGPVDATWWRDYGLVAMAKTWKMIDNATRIRERHRWLTPEDEIRMRAGLIERNLITEAPALAPDTAN